MKFIVNQPIIQARNARDGDEVSSGLAKMALMTKKRCQDPPPNGIFRIRACTSETFKDFFACSDIASDRNTWNACIINIFQSIMLNENKQIDQTYGNKSCIYWSLVNGKRSRFGIFRNELNDNK